MEKCVNYIKNQLSVEKIVIDGFQLRQHSECTIKEKISLWLPQKIPFCSIMRDNLNEIQKYDGDKEKKLNLEIPHSIEINNIKKIHIFK
jgi:hypothetical protein